MTTSLDQLAARIRRLEEQIKRNKQPQLAYSTVEDGAIGVRVLGEETMQIGYQYDGTSTVATLTGPPPPTPTMPLVEPVPGGLRVTWDGQFIDADGFADPGIVAPMDWKQLDIVVSTDEFPDFLATRPTTSLISPRGGTVFLALPGEVLHHVAFVARSHAGKPSTPSQAADGIPLPLVQTTGSGNKIFRQSATPTAESANDVWYAPGNLVYIATGPGTGVVGTDIDGVWDAAPITASAVDDSVLIANDVYGRDGYFGSIDATQITGRDLRAALALLGSLTVGIEGGRSIVLDQAGLQLLDTNGDPIIQFPLAPGAINTFTGDIVAKGLTIDGKAQLMGALNELSANSTFTLQAGVTPPANYVSINAKVTSAAKASGYSYVAASSEMLKTSWRVYDGEAAAIPELAYGSLSTGAVRKVGLTFTAGSGRATAANIRRGNSSAFYGFDMLEPVQLGSSVYTLFWKYDSYNWLDWARTSDSTALPLPTTTKPQLWLGKFDATTGAMQAEYRWDATYNLATWKAFTYFPTESNSSPPDATPALATDGTYLYIAQVRPSDRKVIIQRFSPTLTLQATITTDLIAPSATTRIASLAIGAFDYGSNRYAITFPGSATVYSVTPSGVTQTAEQWSAPSTGPYISWDGTRFMADGRLMSTSKSSSQVWSAYTWRDNRPAGTGTHETTPGPATFATRTPRYGVSFTVTATPKDGGGDDDPNSVGIYAVEGTSSAGMKLQSNFITPPTTTVTKLDALDTGTAAPTTNTFPNGAASVMKTALGGFILQGDGSGDWPQALNPLRDRLTALEGGSAVEVGDIVTSARTSKSGYLLCNGLFVSKTTYAALFAQIGHKFNNNVDPGDGTFKLPDLRDRVPMGASTAKALGTTGGSDTHTLSLANLPEHSHQIDVNHISNTTSGGTQIRVNGVGGAGGGGGSTITAKGTTDPAGSATPTAINHTPRYTALNHFIKF